MTEKKTDLIREMQEELFKKQGEGWFRIISGSMRPLIDVHDRILARWVSPVEVQPADIILFKNRNVFITHRVITIYKQDGKIMILQKGDASAIASTILPESILGKVVAIEKRGRILKIDRGWVGRLNSLLGVKNCSAYRLDQNFYALKQRFRGKPGFRYVRSFYRLLKKPFVVLNRVVERSFFT
jgi:signal peptidase I